MKRLSEGDRKMLDKNFKQNDKRKKDRRVAINSVIDPKMDRRISGKDRRKNVKSKM